MPEYINYHKSIAGELLATKDRVRDFIGCAHWGEDGRYKEAILSDVLGRSIPAIAKIGTGFVVGSDGCITRQIDILIYDTRFPMLFQKGDFVIAPKESVLAIIEVKTTIRANVISDVIDRANENGSIIGSSVFNGIFGFDTDISFDRCLPRALRTTLEQSGGNVNHISFGKDHFMKRWDSGQPSSCYKNPHYSFYRIHDLSFGYFISNLVEAIHVKIHKRAIAETLERYLYPIEETKEAHRLKFFEIDIPAGQVRERS